MNLSFSTNGWKLSFETLLKLLSENKIFGLELHDASSSVFGAEKPFEKQNLSATKKKLFEYGVTVSCVDSVSNLADGKTAENAKEITSLISLCKDIDCKYVRLHAFSDGCEDFKTCDEQVKTVVKAVLPAAEKSGVTLLIETMGIYADTARLADTLGDFARDDLSCVWDVHHTFRFAGETPDKTVKNLGKHIKHIHIKDSENTASGV